jgi:hypothetical protein
MAVSSPEHSFCLTDLLGSKRSIWKILSTKVTSKVSDYIVLYRSVLIAWQVNNINSSALLCLFELTVELPEMTARLLMSVTSISRKPSRVRKGTYFSRCEGS